MPENILSDHRELFTENTAANFAAQDKSEVLGVRFAGAISGSVIWPVGATGGKLIFESSPVRDFAGTWAVAMTIDFAGGGAANSVQAANVFATLLYIRARWETAPTGGATKPRVFLGWNMVA